MARQPLVSVIVPVYKVEPYLRRCVDSVLAQTYPNTEVILVDDGSPDGCPAICDEYAASDSRVSVIHQANGGLSAARNAALDVARGEWVYFVDSDDWVEPDIIEACIEKVVEHGVDMVVFDHLSEGGRSFDGLVSTDMPEGVHSSYETLNALYHDRIDFGAWHILFARRLFDGVRFPPGEISEDIAIMFLLVDAARSVYVLHKVGYHYVVRTTSITWEHGYHMLGWEMYQTMRMVDFARERYPELVSAAEARAAVKAAIFAKNLAHDESLEELEKLRAFIIERDLHPVGITPRSKVGWRVLLLSPRLFISFNNVWDHIRHPKTWGRRRGQGSLP